MICTANWMESPKRTGFAPIESDDQATRNYPPDMRGVRYELFANMEVIGVIETR